MFYIWFIISQDHNRKSGRLIVLSGRTGENIGSRFLPAPHKKEIYMSPVMYKTKDGSQYILFGSGGETVPGIIITLDNGCQFTFYYKKTLPGQIILEPHGIT